MVKLRGNRERHKDHAMNTVCVRGKRRLTEAASRSFGTSARVITHLIVITVKNVYTTDYRVTCYIARGYIARMAVMIILFLASCVTFCHVACELHKPNEKATFPRRPVFLARARGSFCLIYGIFRSHTSGLSLVWKVRHLWRVKKPGIAVCSMEQSVSFFD